MANYDPKIYSGSPLNFDYSRLQEEVPEKNLARYAQSLRQRYAHRAAMWNRGMNTEWMLREYSSMKLLFAADLMLSSAEYASEMNVRLAEPYLIYYGLFNAARAVVMWLPEQPWDNGILLRISHRKVRNVLIDCVRYFDKGLADRLNDIVTRARAYRELFSYRFPMRGIKAVAENAFESVSVDEAVEIATLLGEIAQWHSEVLDSALSKRVTNPIGFDERMADQVSVHGNVMEHPVFDEDDHYRINQMMRRETRPRDIYGIMREGMTEDFYASWEAQSPTGEEFSPQWSLIYPFR